MYLRTRSYLSVPWYLRMKSNLSVQNNLMNKQRTQLGQPSTISGKQWMQIPTIRSRDICIIWDKALHNNTFLMFCGGSLCAVVLLNEHSWRTGLHRAFSLFLNWTADSIYTGQFDSMRALEKERFEMARKSKVGRDMGWFTYSRKLVIPALTSSYTFFIDVTYSINFTLIKR